MNKKIIHFDLDAFFCAVEELRDPTLSGKPFAVGGEPQHRGVVASCSYAARTYGVHSAMSMAQALKLCPQLRVIHSRHISYQDVSNKVMEKARDLTPLVEQLSIDEAFLDVSDLPQSGYDIAKKLQNTIHERFGLPCSFGIATNKLISKIANDVGKDTFNGPEPPNAITYIPPGEESSFLSPLPVQKLWGVGPRTAERLETLGITKIGELAYRSEQELTSIFGKLGHDLAQRSKGIDQRPVVTTHQVKSISQEVTFAQDIYDMDQLRKNIYKMSEKVGIRLRKAKLNGSTIKIKIRWSDFTTINRQITLDHPTDLDQEIYQAASTLFFSSWRKGEPVRLLGVGISNLGSMARQLQFWNGNIDKEKRLQEAIDLLRGHYGKNVLYRGIPPDQK